MCSHQCVAIKVCVCECVCFVNENVRTLVLASLGLYVLVLACVCISHLCDAWVGALAVDAVVFQPLALRVGAVLLEGAAVLSFTPYTPKQRVCLQTQTTASTLGITLV